MKESEGQGEKGGKKAVSKVGVRGRGWVLHLSHIHFSVQLRKP